MLDCWISVSVRLVLKLLGWIVASIVRITRSMYAIKLGSLVRFRRN